MVFKDINEALDYVMSKRNQHKGFDAFKELMASLGNPQDSFKTVHVAGTNGKGSTVTYLRDLLMSQGLRVGTMQSPHYLSHLDRIRVNGENMKEESFLRLVNKYHDLFEEKVLNMFEIDFVLASDYFDEEKIDVAIIEVGLGGRLDATNTLTAPLLSIITTIGYDHMELLGDTLEKITLEKCGIIKENCPVLTGHLGSGLEKVVNEVAVSRHSPFYTLDGYEVKDHTLIYHDRSYHLSSLALYQFHNASLALRAYELIKGHFEIKEDETALRRAIEESHNPGRFTVLKKEPLIIMDGAHNIHGIEALASSVDALRGRKLIIFSALARKEYKRMISCLYEHCDHLALTRFDHEGVMDLSEFENLEHIDDYVSYIKENEKNYDVIILCGSLYFISEVALKCEAFL